MCAHAAKRGARTLPLRRARDGAHKYGRVPAYSPNARMNTVQERIEHPQLASRDRWRDVASAAGPVRMLKPPFNFDGMEIPMSAIPAVGQHTDAILAEVGIDAATTANWRAKGIV